MFRPATFLSGQKSPRGRPLSVLEKMPPVLLGASNT
ncbi:hypothetical protein BH23CHL8_BH23CHL8_27900 [soil metagenome]